MNIHWLQNEDNLIYIDAEKDLRRLEVQLQLPGLQAAAQQLRDHPTQEGLTLKGPRRTTARLFIPNLLLDTHIEMGENLFLYRGEMVECYVIYWINR